jgi:hypothetical protein
MKVQKSKYSFASTSTLVLYIYFLIIGFSHFHFVDIEFFTGISYNSSGEPHDFYAADNFCKLSQTINSLFQNAADNEVYTFFNSDELGLFDHLESPLLRINTNKYLRAPPSEIS